MNWLSIIILAVSFVGAFILFYRYMDCEDFLDMSLAALPSILTAGIVYLIFFAFAAPKEPATKYTVEKSHTEYLVQAQVTDKVEGYYRILHGQIEDRDVYRFYVKSGDGYRMDYLYADNSRIVESTDTPKVVYYDRIKYIREPNQVAKAMYTEKFWNDFFTSDCKHMGVIYVPKGTIIENKFDNLNL